MEPIEVVPDHVQVGPFHERQRALGATFYEDMGWLWTAAFGDPLEEYWAVRRRVGLWDVSALVKFRFAGPDALAALDRLTVHRQPRTGHRPLRGRARRTRLAAGRGDHVRRRPGRGLPLRQRRARAVIV